jgi:hypothetical protein
MLFTLIYLILFFVKNPKIKRSNYTTNNLDLEIGDNNINPHYKQDYWIYVYKKMNTWTIKIFGLVLIMCFDIVYYYNLFL